MRLRIPAILFLFAALLSLTLTGCKDEDVAPNVLPLFSNYFPDTTIYDFDKRFLWIQTHIDGISSSAADLMFKQDCDQANSAIKKKSLGILKNIHAGLIIAQKKVLIVGFNRFWVVWPVRNGVDYQGIPLNYQIMDYQMFRDWFTRSLGFFPTPNQIRVITLRDVQTTPKGQPMQLQTLAEIQQQKGQQPKQETSYGPRVRHPVIFCSLKKCILIAMTILY